MIRNKKISKYFIVAIKKIFLLTTVSMFLLVLFLLVFYLITIYFLSVHYFSLPFYVPTIINLFPVISLIIIFSINRDEARFLHRLADYKYNILFPFIFIKDKNPKRNKNILLDTIAEKIQSGDIILRKYKNYLDGLVFSENSYFTHIGICKKYDNDRIDVYHATGRLGVHCSDLKSFCICEEIAVIRFKLSDIEEDILIRDSINNDKRTYNENESKIFEYLLENISSKLDKEILKKKNMDESDCYEVVLKCAKDLVGITKYDSEFNFYDFKKMSCVEYVWYCFKCVFPLHRIKVEDLEFFNFLYLPVIVPDAFIKNDHFHYVYSSFPKIDNKARLISHIKLPKRKFLPFLFSIFICDLILIVVFYVIFHTWLHIA